MLAMNEPVSAELALTRAAARFVGSGAVFYIAVLTPDAFDQAGLVAAWWTPVTMVAVTVAGVALFASSWRGITEMRSASIAFAVVYLVCATTFLTSTTGELFDPTRGTWLSLFPGLPAVALAAVLHPLSTLAYLLVASALSQFMTWVVRADPPGSGGVIAYVWSVSFSALFAAAAYSIVRSARVLDRTAEAARVQAGVAASAESRDAERRRFDALIHDGVMATLLSAGRTSNNALLTNQALETTRQLDRLRSGIQERTDLAIDDLTAHVRAAANSVDDEITVLVTGDRPDELLVSADAARALAAGVVEATRNVRRHADTAAHRASCEVHVSFPSGDVRVDVVDDGAGFDPARVPAHRLGLQVSIRSRFAALPGGWSRIDSVVGDGTRVSFGCAAL